MKPNHLSREDHARTGLFLGVVHDELTSLVVRIGNSYPLQSREYGKARAALKAVDMLRSALDSRLFKEHEGIGLADLYYGPRTSWSELAKGLGGAGPSAGAGRGERL